MTSMNEQEVEYERLIAPLLGVSTNLEPQAACDSSSRSAMRSSFMMQQLVVEGATPRRLTTLAEREYGKYTMSISVPCNCKVLRVIRKYPKSRGIYSFNKNSETTIVYESLKNGEIGSITIPTFHCNHKVFGFQYVENPILKHLSQGDILEEGTILADSPSVDHGEDGSIDYRFGIEANSVFLSVPGIIEDGVVISESFAKKARSRGYVTKTMEFGSDQFPLNLYGDDDDYKIFPDIGDKVRPDGIVFATRDYDPILAVCNMSKEALKTINHTFDNITYLPLTSIDNDDPPTVEDIVIYHTHNPELWVTPTHMEKQLRKYYDATRIYNTSIIEVYDQELRRRKQHLQTTNEFHQLVVRSLVADNNMEKYKLPRAVIRTYHKSKLDDWRVDVKVGWNVTPGLGAKFSDMHGKSDMHGVF